MSEEEINMEINRVKTALQKTESRKLEHDYGKYLKKLYRKLRYYNRSVKHAK